MKDCFLGIDTSAYTTSAAVFSENGEILENCRKLLDVPKGERGLRQSDAFYRHWETLSIFLQQILKEYGSRIKCVCVSTRPRPVQGSYMPVFNAGKYAAEIAASALGVNVFETTHQEGHVLAASYGNDIDFSKDILFAHLSGGTLELVRISGGKFSIAGGTKDISYGQLLDRFGVMRGFPFPAGKYIDNLALGYKSQSHKNPISRIYRDKTFISLSGTEDKLKSSILADDELSYYLLDRISESLVNILDEASETTGAHQILIGGGVACSSFIRDYCSNKAFKFGRADLCSDNAVGAAMTGGKNPWL